MIRYSGVVVAVFAVAFGCCFHGGVAQYDNCPNGAVADTGNGRCDAALNVTSCGYDGGDCCPCTCVDGPTHACSTSDFDCLYPDCGESATASEDTFCEESWMNDGFCSTDNNHPSCDYDGGDLSWADVLLIISS